jgi:alpha-L-fucosidase
MLLAVLVLAAGARAEAQAVVGTPPSTRWFEDAKYGLFLHFGLFSLPAGEWQGRKYYGISEWLPKRARIPLGEYRALASRFQPSRYDADAWVRFAKSAGFRYIVITAKHHEGFAMFDSRVSDFTITKATPFGRDILKELADACRVHGMKLGFYYSQTQDWNEYDAVGNDWEWPKDRKRDFAKYLQQKCKPQLEELLTRYGDVAILWFDTPDGTTPDESRQLVEWVRRFQPNCLTSSRVGNGLGDYLALRDHELPVQVINRPFEALFTHNDSWGYSTVDKNFRSPREIVRLLVESNARGGNLIFNVGPTPMGTFQQEALEDLNEVGAWLKRNGAAIYGTRASPLPPTGWGVCTSAPGELFLHVLDWPRDGVLRVPTGRFTPVSVSLLSGGRVLPHRFVGQDLRIEVPPVMPDPLNTVIRIRYKGTLSPPAAQTLTGSHASLLIPETAASGGATVTTRTRWMEEFGDWHHASYLDGWRDSTDRAEWAVRVPEPVRFWVVLDYSFDSRKKPAEGVVTVGGQTLSFQSLPTGDKVQQFRSHRIGMVRIPAGEAHVLRVSPREAPEGFIQLRSVHLEPYR